MPRLPRPVVLLVCVWSGVSAGPAAARPGDLDVSFSRDGKQTTRFAADTSDGGTGVAIQADGKIVVAGVSLTHGGADSDFAVARYDRDGTLDRSFSDDGRQKTDFSGREDEASAVAIQADGRVVVVGRSSPASPPSDPTRGPGDFAVARYNADGTLDGSFSGDGRLTTDFASQHDQASAVAIQADGRIVVAGTASVGGEGEYSDFAVVRYEPDGRFDGSFAGDGKQTTDFSESEFSDADTGEGVAIQADGKIVVAGSACCGSTAGSDFAVARYGADGRPDESFSDDGRQTTDLAAPIGKALAQDEGRAVAVQADGKIVVVGDFRGGGDAVSGQDFQQSVALVRYAPDGALDDSFSDDGQQITDFAGTFDFGKAVALQTDGRIVVAGQSDQPSGSYDFGLYRFGADGTLDQSFGVAGRQRTPFAGTDSTSPGAAGEAMAIQADGRIVVAGRSGAGFALARYEAMPDNAAPAARLSGPRVQRARRTVAVNVSCPAEACRVRASGTVRAAGRRFELRSTTRGLGAGREVELTLGVPHKTLRAVRAALRRKRKVIARIRVQASDGAGNTRTRRRAIKLRR